MNLFLEDEKKDEGEFIDEGFTEDGFSDESDDYEEDNIDLVDEMPETKKKEFSNENDENFTDDNSNFVDEGFNNETYSSDDSSFNSTESYGDSSQVVSKRVVSEEVIDDRPQSFGTKLKNSFVGILVGILLIPISLYLVYYGEVKTIDYSKVLKTAVTKENAKENSLVKITGKIEDVEDPYIFEKKSFIEFKKNMYIFQTNTKTEYKTVTKNGKKVRQKIEKKVNEWTYLANESDYKRATSFKINNSKIILKDAEMEVNHDYTKGPLYNRVKRLKDEPKADKIGDKKVTYSGLTTDNEVLVVGKLQNNEIKTVSNKKEKSDHLFVVTTKSYEELEKQYQTSAKFKYWGMKVLTVILLSSGLSMLIGPFLLLLNHIPLVGKLGTSIINFIIFIISLIIVTLVTILIKLFWVLVILLIIGIFMIIKKAMEKRES